MGLDAPGGEEATANYRTPQVENGRLPQTTARAAESVNTFAVANDLADDDADEDFNPFAVVDSNEWRVERRYRLRQDGHKVMYWNYRRRKIERTEDGRQIVEYLSGGKRIVS